jgi:hypothetical protein
MPAHQETVDDYESYHPVIGNRNSHDSRSGQKLSTKAVSAQTLIMTEWRNASEFARVWRGSICLYGQEFLLKENGNGTSILILPMMLSRIAQTMRRKKCLINSCVYAANFFSLCDFLEKQSDINVDWFKHDNNFVGLCAAYSIRISKGVWRRQIEKVYASEILPSNLP